MTRRKTPSPQAEGKGEFCTTVPYQGTSSWSRAAISHCEERLMAQFMPGSAGNLLHTQHSRLGFFPPGQFSSSGGAQCGFLVSG